MHAGLSLLLAYAVGCVSFASIVALCKGVDIRASGSGNPGATNVGRILGRGWGRTVLLLDIAKGAVPVLLLAAPPLDFGLPSSLPSWLVDSRGRVLVAAAAVLGHVWPLTLAFRGGKGVATLLGALLALDVVLGSVALGAHLAAKRLVGYVSLASVVLAWAFPLQQVLLRLGPAREGRFIDGVTVLAALALVVTWRHVANFRRIRAGTEDRYDDASRRRAGARIA